MRAIAVVGVREFELAEEGLARYESAVGQGLARWRWRTTRANLKQRPAPVTAPTALRPGATAEGDLGIVAMDRTTGLSAVQRNACRVHQRPCLAQRRRKADGTRRAAGRASRRCRTPEPDAEMPMPGTANAMPVSATEVLMQVEEWQRQGVKRGAADLECVGAAGRLFPAGAAPAPIDLAPSAPRTRGHPDGCRWCSAPGRPSSPSCSSSTCASPSRAPDALTRRRERGTTCRHARRRAQHRRARSRLHRGTGTPTKAPRPRNARCSGRLRGDRDGALRVGAKPRCYCGGSQTEHGL
jgi:hypothetical protein